MTKPHSQFVSWCWARGSTVRGSAPLEPRPLGHSARQLPVTRAEYSPLVQLGMQRGISLLTHQRRIRLVSPNQLLKHHTDDYGCSAYTGSENIKRPIAIKAVVAAREHGTIMLRGHRQHLLLTELLSRPPVNPNPGSYMPSELTGGLGYVFSYHSFGSSHWQTRWAEWPVVSAGFPSWDHGAMKKHQRNQGVEQN